MLCCSGFSIRLSPIPQVLFSKDVVNVATVVPSNMLMGDFGEISTVTKNQAFLLDGSSASSHPVHMGLKWAKGVWPRVAR